MFVAHYKSGLQVLTAVAVFLGLIAVTSTAMAAEIC